MTPRPIHRPPTSAARNAAADPRAPERSTRALAHSSAFRAALKTAGHLERGFAELFKAHDLSLTQYNVLRILRGSGPDGATCGDVGDNLIQHDPDVTRLLDRLDRRGLIERGRDTKDRRVVRTRITKAGLALLADLDGPVDDVHERQLGHLSEERLAELTAILDAVREGKP
jgi:DNA-binding MarR family transcriptional regulator